MSSYQAYRGPTRPDNYPYPPSKYNNLSTNSLNPPATKLAEEDRRISRTPSPTPSELEALKTGALDWKTLSNWRFWLRKQWTLYYVIFFLLATITILSTVYHTQIVHWLTPVATWMHNLRFGWLVPVGILFVISFPPLFGHEIVAVLCGLIWGLWAGFGIVALGSFLGEVGNFYAFKYCCRARGEKLERTKLFYACLAKVIREGGFKIALIARLSLIPGHFTTALFSTCGMSIWTFCIAAILSSPKQFITVYLGVILDSSSTKTSTKSRVISDSVVAATAIITGLAMWWILRKMNQAKPAVIYDKRKARQAKLARLDFSPYANANAVGSSQTVGFNPRSSDSEIPLSVGDGSMYHQQWDKEGRAVGYAVDPQLHAPQPKRLSETRVAGRAPIQRNEDSGGYDYSNGVRYGPTPSRQASDDSYDAPYTLSPPGIPPPSSDQKFQGYFHRPPSVPSGAVAIPVPTSLTATQTTHQPQSHPRHDAMQTPTQGQFGAPPSADVTSPSFDPLPSPNFSQAGHPQARRESTYYSHTVENTGDSFHTAYGGHSRPGTDATTSSELAYSFSPQNHSGDLR